MIATCGEVHSHLGTQFSFTSSSLLGSEISLMMADSSCSCLSCTPLAPLGHPSASLPLSAAAGGCILGSVQQTGALLKVMTPHQTLSTSCKLNFSNNKVSKKYSLCSVHDLWLSRLKHVTIKVNSVSNTPRPLL